MMWSFEKFAARYTMRVDKSVIPVVKPARKIPQAMEKKVTEESGNMVKKGAIVRETEPTEWVSQMVATRKKNGDVRICLDPRDLNKLLKRPHHPSCWSSNKSAYSVTTCWRNTSSASASTS